MIKKILGTFTLCSLIGFGAQAQTVKPCGTDEVYHQLLKAYPQIAEKDAALNAEIFTKLNALTTKELLPFAKTTDDGTTVYDVPLVFHVIHDYGTEYISDNAIESCVARMNKLYNKQNADTIDAISTFRGFINNSSIRYIGNARITWHLAKIDPEGKPTNGVTRRRSYLTNYAGDNAKFDQWPPNNYMNVWVINKMSPSHSSAAAYAYKPATADVIPYYDGPIMMKDYISEASYTLSHELGHELNLDHTWGGTNQPEVACGDDDVDDTPPTKGHSSCGTAQLYDTACLYFNRIVGKPKLDSLKRADSSLALKIDNSTTVGMGFKNITRSVIESVQFYPSAPIGSTYKIGLKKNSVIIDSFTLVSTKKDVAETANVKFKVPVSDTAANFTLFFMQNPGAWIDSTNTTPYSNGVYGTVFLKNKYTNGYYNFFYNWKVSYGFYKVYGADSLVDYPDTVNAQNVMDYSYCSKMFTTGQVNRMRAALTSTTAKRNELITLSNLIQTGIKDAAGNYTPVAALKPRAEFSVERAVSDIGTPAVTPNPSYFMCADNSSLNFNFKFQDRSWQSSVTSRQWILSNSPTTTALTGTTVITRFNTPGWVKAQLIATNANGSDTFETEPGVYVADPNAANPIGMMQDFTDATENAKWPMFNYYNNRFKWELTDYGTYDNKAIRYRSFDNRTFPDILVDDAYGDYDDFFTPAYDLSGLGDNGNLNFMYAGAYATNNPDYIRDTLEIYYSTTCGATWALLKTIKNAELQTVGAVPMGIEFTPKWNSWKPMSIDLVNGTTKIRNSKVFFRFRYRPYSRPIGQYSYAAGNNFYMDRINISNNPLSINEMILGDRQVAIAPNPATNSTFVLFQKPNKNVNIQVLDYTGKLVYQLHTSIDQHNAKVEIPVAQFGAKGIYMVRIAGENGLNQTEKLVVY